MRCIRCGKKHNGTYGQRCEDCWALAQPKTGPVGIPYLSDLGEGRPLKRLGLSPDFLSLVRGGAAVA